MTLPADPAPDPPAAPGTLPPGGGGAGPGRSPLGGCAIVFAGLVLMAGLVAYALWLGNKQASEIARFTQQEAVPLPAPRLDDPGPLAENLAVFERAARSGTRSELALTAAEINHLIATDPALAEFRNNLRIERIASGKLITSICYPVNRPPWEGGVRYLVGEMVLVPSLDGGQPRLTVEALSTPDREVPPWFVRHFKVYQPLERYHHEASWKAVIRQLSEFTGQDDRLVLRTKAWPEPSP